MATNVTKISWMATNISKIYCMATNISKIPTVYCVHCTLYCVYCRRQYCSVTLSAVDEQKLGTYSIKNAIREGGVYMPLVLTASGIIGSDIGRLPSRLWRERLRGERTKGE